MKTEKNEFCLCPYSPNNFPNWFYLSETQIYLYLWFLFNLVSALLGGVISARHIVMYYVMLSQLFIKSQNSNLIIPILWLQEWRLRAVICLDVGSHRVKGEELRFHICQVSKLQSHSLSSLSFMHLILKWVLWNYVNLCPFLVVVL